MGTEAQDESNTSAEDRKNDMDGNVQCSSGLVVADELAELQAMEKAMCVESTNVNSPMELDSSFE